MAAWLGRQPVLEHNLSVGFPPHMPDIVLSLASFVSYRFLGAVMDPHLLRHGKASLSRTHSSSSTVRNICTKFAVELIEAFTPSDCP